MQRIVFLISLIAMLSSPICASAQTAPATEMAPTGKLRSAVIGIRVLGGVGEPIGKFIAENLGLPFESVAYPTPQAYEQSFGKGEWDIAIGPRVLAPADKSDVTPDVWLIDLLYLRQQESSSRALTKSIAPASKWAPLRTVHRTAS